MSEAKNRKHYIESWEAHINALVDMFTTADAKFGSWEKHRERLLNVLEIAADNAYPQPRMTGDLPAATTLLFEHKETK